jgi:predicted transcriptional regulator
MRAAVIDYVRSNPGSTAGDVAAALNLNRNSIATRLAQLTKSGELVKRGYAAG